MKDVTLPEPATRQKIYENPIIKDKAVFLKTSQETNGEYTLIEVEVAPGGGNELHIHHSFAETFRPLMGDLEVQVGKKRTLLKQGESFTVQPLTKHAFHNPSDKPVKFLVELRPGHEGFENSLKIAYGLACDGLTDKKSVPKKFSHLALVLTMSDTYLPGLLALLMPVFKWKARQAQQSGIAKELINTYCG
ncbi:MAG: cupin domain-containing protein [Adhaeribacter sp.]